MTPIKKEWIAGGLVLASAGVWIPQLLDSGTDDTPRQIVDAQGDVGLPDNQIATPTTGIESGSDGDAVTPNTEDSGQDLGVAPPLSDALQTPGGSRDIASILQALAAETEDPTPLSDPQDSAPPEMGDMETLRAFSEKHPLQGAILGPEGGVVLLGHRIVHVGDSLERGRVQLREIGPGWCTIERGETTLRLDLPPFVARSASPADSNQTQDSGTQRLPETESDAASLSMDDPTQSIGQGGAQ